MMRKLLASLAAFVLFAASTVAFGCPVDGKAKTDGKGEMSQPAKPRT